MKIKKCLTYLSMLLLVTFNSLFLFIDDFNGVRVNSSPTGNKVCLVIVDGLRYDTACKMKSINNMIKQGKCISYKIFAEVPSLSRPGYERIISGASTCINGISSNFDSLPSVTPGLFRLAVDNKLKTAVSAFYWFKELYPTQINYGYYYLTKDSHVFDKGIEFIEKYNPDFLVIHPMSVDRAGHKYGGNSSEYNKTSEKVDIEIMKLFPFVKNNGYTLIITSDHGHRDSGGHGDNDVKCLEVPLFIIKPKSLQIEFKSISFGGNQRDIAPTICDILGIPKTIYMSGNSLVKSIVENDSTMHCFYPNKNNDIKTCFRKSFNVSNIVISLITSIYMGIWMIIIKLL